MKTDLDHLPDRKRRELEHVVKVLFEEFEDALAGRNAPHRKAGRILKIILFGSYARGDWVEDPVGGYFSDYDLLVVVNHDELADVAEYWTAAEDHLVRDYVVTKKLQTQIGFIVHSLTDVNRQLKQGRYFFTDIVREGIALYEAPDHPFVHPEPLSEEAALEEAQRYFDEWFPSARRFLESAEIMKERGGPKEAAFLLHQSAERLYHCLLLVRTLYSPKSHKLNFLRDLCEELEPNVIAAWPRETKFNQRCFELLRRAYVDARYSPHYRITDEELSWLIDRVNALSDVVRAACDDRLHPRIGEA